MTASSKVSVMLPAAGSMLKLVNRGPVVSAVYLVTMTGPVGGTARPAKSRTAPLLRITNVSSIEVAKSGSAFRRSRSFGCTLILRVASLSYLSTTSGVSLKLTVASWVTLLVILIEEMERESCRTASLKLSVRKPVFISSSEKTNVGSVVSGMNVLTGRALELNMGTMDSPLVSRNTVEGNERKVVGMLIARLVVDLTIFRSNDESSISTIIELFVSA